MRSMLLASAAFILVSGVALAQTPMPAPAPDNATNGSPQTSQGMSPGKTPSADSNQGASNGTGYSNSTTQNPPVNAPQNGQMGDNTMAPNTAGTSSNNAGMNGGSPMNSNSPMGNGANAMNNSSSSHHAMQHGDHALPQNASASTYLRFARDALRHHQRGRADDALSHAETLMLTRAVPQSAASEADSSPGITAIENARQALRSGNYQQASVDTERAMRHSGGGMGMEGSSGGMGNSSMNGGAGGMGSNGMTGSGGMGSGMGAETSGAAGPAMDTSGPSGMGNAAGTQDPRGTGISSNPAQVGTGSVQRGTPNMPASSGTGTSQ